MKKIIINWILNTFFKTTIEDIQQYYYSLGWSDRADIKTKQTEIDNNQTKTL